MATTKGRRYIISAHHYSREKQRARWLKEGKAGQVGIDYIFRFTRSELQALFPCARIRAVGFYRWPAQSMATQVFGYLLARMGYGHMPIVHGRKPFPGPC